MTIMSVGSLTDSAIDLGSGLKVVLEPKYGVVAVTIRIRGGWHFPKKTDCSFRWFYRTLDSFDDNCHVPRRVSYFGFLVSALWQILTIQMVGSFCPPAQP